jgi:hypothetical protein
MATRNFNSSVTLPVRRLRELRQVYFSLSDLHMVLERLEAAEQSSYPYLVSVNGLVLERFCRVLESLEVHHGVR